MVRKFATSLKIRQKNEILIIDVEKIKNRIPKNFSKMKINEKPNFPKLVSDC